MLQMVKMQVQCSIPSKQERQQALMQHSVPASRASKDAGTDAVQQPKQAREDAGTDAVQHCQDRQEAGPSAMSGPKQGGRRGVGGAPAGVQQRLPPGSAGLLCPLES